MRLQDQPLRERFFEKLEPEPGSGCWMWTAADNGGGYGKISDRGRSRGAHQVAWELFRGPIGDHYVLHHCDVKRCVNPEHLYLGDQQQNMDDMAARGRARRNGVAKLSVEQVDEIRGLAGERTGVTVSAWSREIATQYSVSPGHIRRIWRGYKRKDEGTRCS